MVAGARPLPEGSPPDFFALMGEKALESEQVLARLGSIKAYRVMAACEMLGLAVRSEVGEDQTQR